MKYPLIIIGGGLSGLAAAIRCSHYVPRVLLLEKHSRLGGLNSYYYRNRTLFETGLHAITNYADKGDKKAPLNKLFRQLKLKRETLSFCPQIRSEILFCNQQNLFFSNDFDLFCQEVEQKFPLVKDRFYSMLQKLDTIDAFATGPFISAKAFLLEELQNPLLVDMILCPLMYYGSSVENDMDLGQFAIMFQAIFKEGMFRPETSIKDFLDVLETTFVEREGILRKNAEVQQIIMEGKRATGVQLTNGEYLEADHILSTAGHYETLRLVEGAVEQDAFQKAQLGRLGFIETIFQLPREKALHLPKDKTITFFNTAPTFSYQQIDTTADLRSGVLCFPQNFVGMPENEYIEVRSTHLASYDAWAQLKAMGDDCYANEKVRISEASGDCIENIIGNFKQDTLYKDSFTPLTIERYTAKIAGAIYGSPTKIKDGDLGFENLFLAGTDQGFLGIVGSMLSGVSIANAHILTKL